MKNEKFESECDCVAISYSESVIPTLDVCPPGPRSPQTRRMSREYSGAASAISAPVDQSEMSIEPITVHLTPILILWMDQSEMSIVASFAPIIAHLATIFIIWTNQK